MPTISPTKTDPNKFTPSGGNLIDLQILEPTDEVKKYYSKVITFSVKKGEVPGIIYNASLQNGKKIIDGNGTLNNASVHENEFVKIKKKTEVNSKGEAVDTYSIGIKTGAKVNLRIGNSTSYRNVNSGDFFSTSSNEGLSADTFTQAIEGQGQPKPTFSLPRVSSNILPNDLGGDKKYSSKHSVFSSINQDSTCPLSYPAMPPDDLNTKEYARLKGGDYSSLKHGSAFLKEVAKQIAEGKGRIPIEAAAVKASNIVSKINNYNPKYRIGESAECNEKQDFEVLFISGKTSTKTETILWSLEEEILNDAISSSYGDRCKSFTTLTAPDKKGFEDAIKEKATLAKKEGRKLYVFYTGHGTTMPHNTYQSGVDVKDRDKEGSKNFTFCFGEKVHEPEFKDLLTEQLEDVETTIILDACHSGSAVTTIEQEKQKVYFSSLA